MKIIQFQNVTVSYENRIALEDVTFDLEEGEFLGIIGPNASGKTTLLKTILGILKPVKGTVLVFGEDLAHNGHIRSNIGYVPQKEYIDPTIPFLVKDLVLMGRYAKIGLFKRPSREDFRLMEQVLRDVGMDDMEDEPVGHLSGGQLQRALIARALISEPRILLLDEPTTGLDVNSQIAIIRLISKLHKEKELTVLFVTHDINTIINHCSRVMYLNRRIYAIGKPVDVLNEDVLRRVYGTDVRILAFNGAPYVAVSDHHA